jgi:dTDP-4-dehydrorhamnose reductase
VRFAVTGKSGQVATALQKLGSVYGHEVIALGRPELDLLHPSFVFRALEAVAPDVIVAAAAYTAVDMAERESELAFAINEVGARAVSRAAAALGVPLVHLSTDYVFDGQLDRPYVESDAPRPTSIYGASKLAGERAALLEQPDSAVLRVAWIYSPFGENFVKTMLRLASQNDELAIVADQVGSPTSAEDVAHGILSVASNLVRRRDAALRGIFHMTAAGETSWADFAKAIFAISSQHGGPFARVRPIGTADYPTAAARPANSRLDSTLIERRHGIALPNWRTSLETALTCLLPA